MKTPDVVIMMGSDTDLPVMSKAEEVLKDFGVTCEIKICSAHRSPNFLHKIMTDYKDAKVFIAGAGMAAHLAGVVASQTVKPVIGVPLSGGFAKGLDAMLSTLQMPSGLPVATVAVDGSKNAAYLAVQILALNDKALTQKLLSYRSAQEAQIIAKNKKK